MAVQPQLLLLQKTMLMAEGMGTRLNPKVNIWELARPLIEEWMQSHFGPRATVGRAVEDLAEGLRRLPRLIDSLHSWPSTAQEGRGQIEGAYAGAARLWPAHIGFSEIVAVLALIAISWREWHCGF
jgi:ubiquinone biosynthesis protein